MRIFISTSLTQLLFPPFGVEWNGTTTGLLQQPRMMMSIEQLVICLAGETEVLGENLPNFVHQKCHMTVPGLEPWPPRREAGTATPVLLASEPHMDSIVKEDVQ
jgi:hypothetical protein